MPVRADNESVSQQNEEKRKQLNEFKVTWIEMKATLKMFGNKGKEGKKTVAREDVGINVYVKQGVRFQTRKEYL